MNTTTLNPEAQRRCPVCQAALPPHVPPSRCPKCLLRAGLSAEPPQGVSQTLVAPNNPLNGPVLPQPGEVFGHYRIIQLLGEGGMGTVFEAEDMECGRRLALKVLGHRLDSPEARSRFLREGRLAASVNHPNSIYVYGTEEIAGVPVIGMELATGGTLQRRVSTQGPLPAAEAVDCVLQIIAGLEAAQKVGVLHRDIKPANCFVEADGTVKIGDFGLSISTMMRAEPSLTATGAFLGTPAFSAPEQLRGDELTVRSDLYAVGATLYYLLTGQFPFTAGNVMQLLATVLERRPDSPAKWRPGLAAGLCRAVLRCLEKEPEKRYRNYDELRAALLPYASAAPTPATRGWRFLATLVDMVLFSMGLELINFLLLAGSASLPDAEKSTYLRNLVFCGSALTLLMVNYVLLEGWWGSSAGKTICGLRVTRLDGTHPGVMRAGLRVLIWFGPAILPWLPGFFIPSWKLFAFQSFPVMLFALEAWALASVFFCTARARNGFAAVYDLVAGTRVILRTAYQARPGLSAQEKTLQDAPGAPLIGPYHVLDKIGHGPGDAIFLGFDARLLRRVWIRRLPPGTPAVPSKLRYMGRPGRLRWLNGRRTETEAWDAYDAPSGEPLLKLISRTAQNPNKAENEWETKRQSWSRVRYWLLDLAKELMVAERDDSLPSVLELDRVWITAEGRARLLDFPAPGTEDLGTARVSNPGAPRIAAFDFLRRVVWSALEGRIVKSESAHTAGPQAPVPLAARRYLESISAKSTLQELVGGLEPLLRRRAVVSNRRRLALLAGGLAFPLLCAVIAAIKFGLQVWFIPADKELAAFHECLVHYNLLCQPPIWFGTRPHARERAALETYIAGRFAPVMTNKASWEQFRTRMAINDNLWRQAEYILTLKSNPPSKEEFSRAEATVLELLGKSPDIGAQESLRQVTPLVAAGMVAYMDSVVFVVVPCVVASLCFGGGVLALALGITYVNRNGSRSSRWRIAGRNLIAWLPWLLLPVVAKWLAPITGSDCAVLLVVGGAGALALTSALLKDRGLPDRLIGTWPVPR